MEKDLKLKHKTFSDGFFGIFQFESLFFKPPVLDPNGGSDYLRSLIKGPEDDLLNLQNDWRNILSTNIEQQKKERERDGEPK